jgi:glycosyltransferase involved in cell wall biosynthesis
MDVASISAAGMSSSEDTDERFDSRLKRLIAEFDPDVIHVGPLSAVAPIVASVWAGPLIAMSWGFDLLRDIEIDARTREDVVAVLRRADQVIVDNDAPARVAISLGADAQRISQFPWGIDIDAFSPGSSDLRSRLGWRASDVVVLSTRRHEDVYDVETVVRAFARAAASAPHLRLLVAGSGSHTPALRAMLADAGLGDRARFLGEVGQLDLPAVYRAADVYVSASLVDGSSVSLLEAMSVGVVACVSDIQGNQQWVSGDRGLVFAVRDDGSLADHILTLVEDRERDGGAAEAMAASARAFVREHADWRKSGSRLVAIADAAISRNRERA